VAEAQFELMNIYLRCNLDCVYIRSSTHQLKLLSTTTPGLYNTG